MLAIMTNQNFFLFGLRNRLIPNQRFLMTQNGIQIVKIAGRKIFENAFFAYNGDCGLMAIMCMNQ